MERNWENDRTGELIKAILSLKNPAETKSFLRDLLTESEIIEFGKRWEAARMLHAGLPYADIIKATGLSSKTIARVADWLAQGKDGYKLALNRRKK